MNSTTHGLNAQFENLPAPVALRVAADVTRWNHELQPRTLLEFELVHQMAFAAAQRHRAVDLYCAQVDDAEANALERHDEALEDELEANLELLETKPSAALTRLRRTGAGLRYLIKRWERFDFMLSAEDPAGWEFADHVEFLRIQAISPQSRNREEAEAAEITMRVFKVLHPHAVDPVAAAKPFNVRDYLLDQHYAEQRKAAGLVPVVNPREAALEWTKDPIRGRDYLRRRVREKLAELRPLEERVRLEHDAPARALAVPRASLPEGPRGANYLRYERQHLLAFHRAYDKFVKGRAQANKTGYLAGVLAPDVEVTGRNEPNPAVGSPEPEGLGPDAAKAAGPAGGSSDRPGRLHGEGGAASAMPRPPDA